MCRPVYECSTECYELSVARCVGAGCGGGLALAAVIDDSNE